MLDSSAVCADLGGIYNIHQYKRTSAVTRFSRMQCQLQITKVLGLAPFPELETLDAFAPYPKATGKDSYLNDARRYKELHEEHEQGQLRVVLDWDNQYWGGMLLLH